MRAPVVCASPAAHDTVLTGRFDLPLELGADALGLPRDAGELLRLDRIELGADSLNGSAVGRNALRLTEELIRDHLLRLVVGRLAEPPLMLAVELDDLVLRLVGQILLEVANLVALLDTVLRGNMRERCVHFLVCLLDFYYRWAAFDFGYFLFQFFLCRVPLRSCLGSVAFRLKKGALPLCLIGFSYSIV